MTGAKKEIAIVLVVAAICWALKTSAPGGRVEAVTFWIVLLLPFVLNVAGWWRWRSIGEDRSTLRWRKILGFGGLAANTLAMGLPFLVFFYNGFLINYDVHHPPGLRGLRQIDLLATVEGCLLLSIAALVAGLVGPRRIRLAVALGAFTMASFILSIRIGVL
jgi:hypothetical protein